MAKGTYLTHEARARIDNELRALLDAAMEREHRTESQIIRLALRAYLVVADEEDAA